MKKIIFLIATYSLLSCATNNKKNITETTSKPETSIPSKSESVPSESTSVPSESTSVPSESTSVPSESTSVPSKSASVQSKSKSIPSKSRSIDHKQWNVLLQKHVSSKGNVDYIGFKKDKADLQSYLDLLSKNLPEKSWSKNAVLSYWINAYNAFTVKLIIDNYPLKSIKDIKDPWGKKFFTLGNKKYSLEEIEHEILRKMNEPRIHFAINCASFSCPNLSNEAYTENKLEKQLVTAAKVFVNDKTKNTIDTNKIEISKIFDWFSGDFKSKGTVVDFLNKYSSIQINANAKIKYKDYNWKLNE